jgi:hypothetical protein
MSMTTFGPDRPVITFGPTEPNYWSGPCDVDVHGKRRPQRQGFQSQTDAEVRQIEHERLLNNAARKLSAEQFDKLKQSGGLSQWLEDEVAGRHNPPAPDPKMVAEELAFNEERMVWESKIQGVIARAPDPSALHDEICARLRARQTWIANGRTQRAEQLEEELADLLEFPVPDRLSAKAAAKRIARGWTF